MSKISRCPRCGGNIVEPAFPGDGDYPVPPMCTCANTRWLPPSAMCSRCGARPRRDGRGTCDSCAEATR